jgi:CHAT domain-containing protein
VYADLVLALIEADRLADALRVADRSRSRALLDHLAAARLRESDTAATSALIAERARVLSRIDALIRRYSATSDRRPRERAEAASAEPRFSAELAALRREYDELMVRSPGSAMPNALVGVERPDVDAVRAALHEDEALLEFFATADRTFAFVVTRTRIGVVSTAVSYDALVDRVRLARDLAAYSGVPDSATQRSRDAVFRALHNELVLPAIASGWLRGVQRLVIVPHGALTYLPFAALRSPSGRSLIEDFALSYVPVAAALPVLRGSENSGLALAPRVVALAPDPSLANSLGEARHAAAAAPGSLVLSGASASERALRDALEEGAIVHLASHGVLETESPMFSRVMVAPGRDIARDDGRLEVHELLAFSVKSPLVFLSGCETGSGVSWSSRYARTGDHATLDQAFLYAGAKTVIATRWRVADRGAAALAERFYAHLPAHDAVEALAMAQRDMIRSAEFRDVHHWAAYAVSGSGGFRLPGSPPLAEREGASARR